jgi:hypothetical protein
MTSAPRIPQHEIDRLNLGADLRDVARSLGVKLIERGGRFTGPCPVCGSGSFTIRKAQAGGWRWDCWAHGGAAAGAGGRALDLLAAGPGRTHTMGMRFRDAIAFLGGDPSRPVERNPEAEAETERQRQEDEAEAARARAEAMAIARDMWAGCVPLDHPDAAPVRSYLRDTRALDLEAALGAWPPHLRFGVVRPWKARPEDLSPASPAMVAAVTRWQDGAMRIVGVHRTFLVRDQETGRWIKDAARFSKSGVKQGLGPIGGGAVRLTPTPMTGGRHLVTEGIETGGRLITALMGAGAGAPGLDWFVWAALSTSGLYGLQWDPIQPKDRVVMADNDPATKVGTHPGQDAARALVQRSCAAGVPAIERVPPVEGADWDEIGLQVAA